MGLPVVLPGIPAPDTNMDSRIVLGGVDLSQPLVTPYGRVRFQGQKLDGWSGGTESTREVVQRAYRPGGTASDDPQSKPRLLTLAMTLIAESPAAMREAWDRLNVAASKDDTALVRDQWGLRRSMTVFRQGDVQETLYRSARVKGWSCQLKAADPRKYGEQVSLSTGLPRSVGGLVGPLVGPLRSDATTVTGRVSWNNVGNEQAPVRLRIDGPCAGPRVTHLGSGRTLTFASSYSVPAGSWLDVELDPIRVTEAGQVSRSQMVTGRQFFTADPGPNDFTFAADTYDANARLTVVTAPAWE